VESEGNSAGHDSGDDLPRLGDKREENARRRGRPFEPGNQAAVGYGRPKKDFDIETRCKELSQDIIEHYATMGKTATTGPEVEAGKVVLAYAHGKPRVRLEHSGPGGGPLQVEAVRTTEQKRARMREIARGAAARVMQGAQTSLPAMGEGGEEVSAGDEQDPEDAGPDGAPGSQ
jgi:hypothetical protein